MTSVWFIDGSKDHVVIQITSELVTSMMTFNSITLLYLMKNIKSRDQCNVERF